jgi:hypothetical protein
LFDVAVADIYPAEPWCVVTFTEGDHYAVVDEK